MATRSHDMSATNRDARRSAVCGSKPGGADSYYLQEHCAPRSPRTSKGKVRSSKLEERGLAASNYHAFCMKQLRDLHSRMEIIYSRIEAQGKGKNAGVDPGFVLSQKCIWQYVTDATKNYTRNTLPTVHVRATRAISVVRGAPKTPGMELIVVQGAIQHYHNVLLGMKVHGLGGNEKRGDV